MLRWLSPLNAWISRLCMYVAVAGLFGIVIVVAWQVFGRYVLNNTPTWAESIALVLVLYVTLLGAAVGVRDARHIGLDSLIIYLVPERHRIWFELTCHFLVGVFGGLMMWNGAVLAKSVMPYKIPILGISEGINHIPLVISGVLIILFSLEHILARIQDKKVAPSWH
jgi:TRAP-type C4-dicarboxylate transport system permease small subunit